MTDQQPGERLRVTPQHLAELQQRIEDGLREHRHVWWQTPPRLDYAAQIVMDALGDQAAENYLEQELTVLSDPPTVGLDLQDGQNPGDSYTVTIQHRYRPTPHEFRRRAERERDEALAELARLRAAATQITGTEASAV